MLVIAAIWWAALSLLTFTSANPTTVNREQVLASDVVVQATVQDVAAGKVTVTRRWKDDAVKQHIVVSGLQSFEVQQGDEIVLPLTGDNDGTFKLTQLKRSQQTYIYPAAAEVFEQLDTIIAGAR